MSDSREAGRPEVFAQGSEIVKVDRRSVVLPPFGVEGVSFESGPNGHGLPTEYPLSSLTKFYYENQRRDMKVQGRVIYAYLEGMDLLKYCLTVQDGEAIASQISPRVVASRYGEEAIVLWRPLGVDRLGGKYVRILFFSLGKWRWEALPLSEMFDKWLPTPLFGRMIS